MSLRAQIELAVCVAALVTMFALGRSSKRCPVQASLHREMVTTTAAAATHETARETAETHTVAPERVVRRVVTRVVRVDGGCAETVETETRTGPVVAATRTIRDTEAQTARATATQATTVAVAPKTPPRWLVGIGYAPPTLGGPAGSLTVGMRAVGPIWATATVTTRKALTLGVAVTW